MKAVVWLGQYTGGGKWERSDATITQQMAKITHAMDKVRAAKKDIEAATKKITDLTAFIKSITFFLGLVDKVIDTAKLFIV